MSMDTQLVELCQALIRRPSVSGEEKGVAEFLKGTMEQLGYDAGVLHRHGINMPVHEHRRARALPVDAAQYAAVAVDLHLVIP